MTTEQMLYLQTVFHEGSLSGAARSLGLSQSTMSKSLQSLEKELGGSLFIRIRGQLLPTRQGYAVLDMARKICSMQEQMTERIHTLRSESGISIAVGFPLYWNYDSFIPVMADFRRLCPSCTLRPVEYAPFRLRQMLEDRTLQLALVSEEEAADMGFRCLPIGKLEILLAGPPETGRKKAAGKFPAVKIHRIPRLPFAMPDSRSMLSFYIKRYFQQQNFTPEILFESPSHDSRLAATKAGLGYTLIPEHSAARAEGTSLFSLSPPCRIPLSLVVSDRPPVFPEQELLTKLLVKHMGTEADLSSRASSQEEVPL
ncbi:MAG TPA: LysR family transcriptional regulator [Candidatus Lachnoclostridium stercorigallinarum]|uniref:LysR family transcriptional regulator n=1 Tax=Candidatus Lachnoclostridium stercorigallinarum TaxID=2838634 RepID=A0A9D2K5U8_9FIRM|nr:LysR family transcriptional regulator [Candidatus Lachnoclostridium stercorigallinarum]